MEPSNQKRAKLVGYDNFVRSNPLSDKFGVQSFHHLEFVAGDAGLTASAWCTALGFHKVAKSTMLTGNKAYASHVIASGGVRLAFSSPYGVATETPAAETWEPSSCPNPALAPSAMHAAYAAHGLSVCAVGLLVDDAAAAFAAAVAGGATPRAPPRTACDGSYAVAEVLLYGDCSLRFVSGAALADGSLAFLPGYEAVAPVGLEGKPDTRTFGIASIDHVVGNVADLLATVDYIGGMTGFHEFAEFTAEDVGTVDSGLNSMVLASNDERVLLPVNEPTYGTRRRSQIQTYLVHHGGEGVQHIALFTDDIFRTVAKMRNAGRRGGFAFMDAPSAEYYRELPERIGGALEADALAKAEELGLLVDRDDQGVLIQVFTRPLGDRPTLFLEIIQRVGCMLDDPDGEEGEQIQSGGCGGFGKGNFKELFKSVEEFERSLELE